MQSAESSDVGSEPEKLSNDPIEAADTTENSGPDREEDGEVVDEPSLEESAPADEDSIAVSDSDAEETAEVEEPET